MLSRWAWVGFLAAGLAVGMTARLALWKKVSLSWAGTILVGMVGAGIGTTVQSLIQGGSAFEPSFIAIVSAVAGSMGILAVYAVIASRLASRAARPLEEILLAGESDGVEFKQTARHNVHTSKPDARIEFAVAKTVASFLNSSGGILLIGVDDDARPVGLDDDLRHLKQPDLDRYQLWLTDMLESALGSSAVASIKVSFPQCGPHRIARIDVDPHPRAVFANPSGGQRAADFYVRIGNSTRLLLTDEAIAYAATHWRWWRKAMHRRSLPPQ